MVVVLTSPSGGPTASAHRSDELAEAAEGLLDDTRVGRAAGAS